MSLLEWMKREWRLMRAHDWKPICTADDERCQRTILRQRQAYERMKRLGIKPLLEGGRGWQRVNPMATSEKPSKVVQIKRTK